MMIFCERQHPEDQRGVGVIEALCAITIIAIAIAGSISIYLSTVRHLATARTYSGVSSDVEAIIEGFIRGVFFFEQLCYAGAYFHTVI